MPFVLSAGQLARVGETEGILKLTFSTPPLRLHFTMKWIRLLKRTNKCKIIERITGFTQSSGLIRRRFNRHDWPAAM